MARIIVPRRMSKERADKVAEGLMAKKTKKQACLDAGYSAQTARAAAYQICDRDEVIEALERKGGIYTEKRVGNISVGVLMEKLGNYQEITNRELAPYVQMGLQTGKKIGAGSVQQTPQTQTNIQINVNPMEQALIQKVLERIQQQNPGKEIIIRRADDEQGPQSNARIQEGQTPLRIEAGTGGEISPAGPGDCIIRDEEGSQ